MKHKACLFGRMISVILAFALLMQPFFLQVHATGSSDQDEAKTISLNKSSKINASRTSEGTSYAVLTAEGDLIFFRSRNLYETSAEEQTVTDILGNKYTGLIYDFMDYGVGFNQDDNIVRVYAADGQSVKLGRRFWFTGCERLKSINTDGIDTSECDDIGFLECTALETVDFSNLNTSGMTDMSRMFEGCKSLKALDLGNFDTSNVTEMYDMFNGCTSLTSVNLKSFNTKNVLYMQRMFEDCKSLKELDFSSFDTSSVLDMSAMFLGCTSLTSLDLSYFHSNTITRNMFNGCTELRTLNIVYLNTDYPYEATLEASHNQAFMFDNCENLTSITLGKGSDFKVSTLPTGIWKNGTKVRTGRQIDSEGGTWTLQQKGQAYAVLDDEGKLTFFRSRKWYPEGEESTAVDIDGNSYHGIVYSDFEDGGLFNWNSRKDSVLAIDIADGQMIIANYGMKFNDYKNVKSIDLRGLYSLYQNYQDFFSNCVSLKTIDLSDFNTSGCINMAGLFSNCKSLETVILGPKFIRWLPDAMLPAGTWYHGTLAKTEVELCHEYPSHASEWAGTWSKTPVSENKEVKKISFSESSYIIPVGQTMVLIPHTEPSDATSKIKITSSNTKVVSNEDNLLFGQKTGTVTVTATADNGVKASCTVRVIFTDVPATGKYYSDPVYWAVEKGITNGYTASDGLARTFRPENFCTREAVVTFLWRLAGKPNPKSMKSQFSDVQDSSKYYYKAVLWASEKGITAGYNDGTFKPSATCLREHVVTFLWRYAGKPEPGVSKNPFNDVKSSDYFYKAALWANAKGIAKGYSDGPNAGGFGPKLDCLREHVVTFLYRYAK